jgi:hypothetical protein
MEQFSQCFRRFRLNEHDLIQGETEQAKKSSPAPFTP